LQKTVEEGSICEVKLVVVVYGLVVEEFTFLADEGKTRAAHENTINHQPDYDL
jgi:hypothetical protein